MVGPSSSHTAGTAAIAYLAQKMINGNLKKVKFTLYGSFAKTYRGHGTDRAIVGGLMGMAVDDPRLRNSLTLAQESGMDVCFDVVNIRGAHPNTVRLTLTGVSGKELTMEAASVGGGNIEIHKLNGLNVDFTGKEHTLIIHQSDAPGVIAAVTGALAGQSINIANMQVYRRKAGADAMMVLELDGAPEDYVLESLKHMKAIRNVTFLKRRPC